MEFLADRPEQAEARLRPGYEKLDRMGERELFATTAALLAHAVLVQDRPEEARLCRVSERTAPAEDIATQVMWRSVAARIRAKRGETQAAEALARRAVGVAQATDLLVLHADALLDLEEVAQLGERPAGAHSAARAALDLYQQKGDVVSAARARSRLRATPTRAR